MDRSPSDPPVSQEGGETLSDSWNKHDVYEEVIRPLLEPFVAACKFHGIPLVMVALDNNIREDAGAEGLHLIVQDVKRAPEDSFVRWIAGCVRAVAEDKPIPIPQEAISAYLAHKMLEAIGEGAIQFDGGEAVFAEMLAAVGTPVGRPKD